MFRHHESAQASFTGVVGNRHFGCRIVGFADAAEELRGRGGALRVFLLISAPFVPFDEQDEDLDPAVIREPDE